MDHHLTVRRVALMVPAAREFARLALADTPIADEGELIVSELASNAVLHGAGPTMTVELSIDRPARSCRIAVSDGGNGGVAIPIDTPDEDAEGARGLWIVAVLAGNVNQHEDRDSNIVWATLAWKDDDDER